ncbi:MAG: response regulator transcription factor [Gammaproteobacteria bacterium]|nr:response regulator transcription factor [Gammaproteobacteria bacterium]
MELRVYSSSRSFQDHLNRVIEQPFDYCTDLNRVERVAARISLLHISSPELADLDWMARCFRDTGRIIGVCSDSPDVVEMLECVEAGCRAYCNSYMQAGNYRQMLRLLANDQSWFPPNLLARALGLAQDSLKGKDTDALLQALTEREKEVAVAVSQGLSNKNISERFKISERTVKAHLTSTYAKLDLKDRVALVIYLR